jgi:hypothetical protein
MRRDPKKAFDRSGTESGSVPFCRQIDGCIPRETNNGLLYRSYGSHKVLSIYD